MSLGGAALTADQARAVVLTKCGWLNRGLDDYAAARLDDGWLLTPPASGPAWVVSDNRRSCLAAREAGPQWLVHNLMADARPSVLTQDEILCVCGHRSATHGWGTPTAHPDHGVVSGIGRGACGHETLLNNGTRRACDCEVHTPERESATS